MLTNKIEADPIYKGKYSFWRIFKIIILGLLIGGILFTFYFIYQNFSNSLLADTANINSLKPNVAGYEINLQTYEKTKAAIIGKKHLEEIPTNIRNIFYYNTNTSTYESSSTKPS